MAEVNDLRRSDFRFFDRLRVRWAEVDMQKIVFNAHYLTYFDTAFSAYWRANALPYNDTMQELQGDLYVRRAIVDFRASAQLDDLIDVGIKCSRIGNSSITFVGGLFRQHDLLVSYEVVYVFADPSTQTSRPVPSVLRKLLLGYEEGDEVIQILSGSPENPGADFNRLWSLSTTEEQIDLDSPIEVFDSDHTVIVAVRNRLDQPVAIGRLIPSQLGGACIEQLTVHKMLRGEGIGKCVLEKLEHIALQRGDFIVSLLTDEGDKSFYTKHGYIKMEEVVRNGVEFTRMERMLR